MQCERFLFEVSYQLESRGREALDQDMLKHLLDCPSCHAQFQRLWNEFCSSEWESSRLMSRRLHETLDQVIAARAAQLERHASFGRLWLQTALVLIILVGSIVGVSYQDHPTATTPVYTHR